MDWQSGHGFVDWQWNGDGLACDWQIGDGLVQD